MAVDPDPFFAVADALRACFCAEVADLTPAPQRCCLLAGSEYELGVSLTEDMCRCGTAWVRIVQISPSTIFPIPQSEAKNCTPDQWVMSLELGIARCPPVGTAEVLPTCDEQLEYTRMVMNDAQAMRRAVSCCFRAQRPTKLYLMREWAPFGPTGLCGGGVLSVDVQLLGCNEC